MKTYTFDQLTDTQKQEIAEKWCNTVANFSCETTLVEYVIKKSIEDNEAPFSYEDIINNERYGLIVVNGSEQALYENERDEKLEFYEYLRDKAETLVDSIDECVERLTSEGCAMRERHERLSEVCDELEAMNFEEQPEIYQWFSCDPYVCRKLEEAGECTLDGSYWGRTCCGQSIVLDHVIQRLAFDHFTDYGKDYITQTMLEANNIWGV